MNEKPLLYRAYLLRLWRESERLPWRASLEDSTSGARWSFAKLEDLNAFLADENELPESKGRSEADDIEGK